MPVTGNGAAGPAPAAGPARIAVSSQLAQSYRLGVPFTVGPQVATVYSAASGLTELVVLDPGGRIFYLRPASDAAGWTAADLHFPGSAAHVTAGANPDGTVVVYAVDTLGALWTYLMAPGTAPAWQRYAGWSTSPDRSGGPATVSDLRIGYEASGLAIPAILFQWPQNDGIVWAQIVECRAPGEPQISGRCARDLR